MDLAEKAGARRPSIVTVLTKLTQGINSAKSQCSRRTSDANHLDRYLRCHFGGRDGLKITYHQLIITSFPCQPSHALTDAAR